MTQIMICDRPVNVVEYTGQRVVTLAMIDAAHQRPEGTARRNFNANKQHMIEGEDYFVRNSSEAKSMGFTAPNGLTLLTESGYLMLVKSFTDDLAWQVQRQLVNSYFRRAEEAKPVGPMAFLNDPAAMRAALLGYTEKVIALESANAELSPKAAAHDHMAALPGDLGVRDAGRELKVGQNWVTDYVIHHKWACREGGKLKPAHYGLQAGYCRLVPRAYQDKFTGETRVGEDFKVTRKGIARLAEIIATLKAKNTPTSAPSRELSNRPFAPQPEMAS